MAKKKANRATEDILGDLHIAVAQQLLDKVNSGEASAAEIQAAIKFLQNNNITATADENPALDGLRKVALPDFTDEYNEE